MQLTLESIVKRVGPQTWLHPMSIAPRSGSVTVLLGATQAGKTSLMRIMAGLDVPSSGRVLVDGRDVVGVSVRERNVAMVYQQFINYPSLRVRDNIASPLKLRREKDIDQRVRALAEKLHIEMFLDRYPAELSGGQQQRVALARALAKDAPLMLLDEPLVNLDYKLREELRDELTALFAAGDSTVIYATTEPGEALLLGGYTAVMDAGDLLQYGPTAEVFHNPISLRVARAFSDPPMNLLAGTTNPDGAVGVQLQGGPSIQLPLSTAGSVAVTVGMLKPGLPVVNADGTPKWRMAPGPNGPYWKQGMQNGYQDVGSWTFFKNHDADKVAAAWLYAQFVTAKTTSLKKTMVGLTPIRESDIQSQAMTDMAPKLGGLVEFYRSPARVAWTPTGTNVPDYPKLAQLWWKNVAVAVTGEKTPQAAMDNLAEEMDSVMARLERAGMAVCPPKLNAKSDPGKWLSDKGAPWAKLANEKPKGETIAYDTLLSAWKNGKVR